MLLFSYEIFLKRKSLEKIESLQKNANTKKLHKNKLPACMYRGIKDYDCKV